MENIQILNLDGNILNIEIIFAFICKENGKIYVALHNKDSIFEPTSRYANIDILELTQAKAKSIYLSPIPEEDWEIVKHNLQFNVFSNIKQ